MKEFNKFISHLKNTLNEAMGTGIIDPDCLNTWKYNRASVAHSRIWGLIAKT